MSIFFLFHCLVFGHLSHFCTQYYIQVFGTIIKMKKTGLGFNEHYTILLHSAIQFIFFFQLNPRFYIKFTLKLVFSVSWSSTKEYDMLMLEAKLADIESHHIIIITAYIMSTAIKKLI